MFLVHRGLFWLLKILIHIAQSELVYIMCKTPAAFGIRRASAYRRSMARSHSVARTIESLPDADEYRGATRMSRGSISLRCPAMVRSFCITATEKYGASVPHLALRLSYMKLYRTSRRRSPTQRDDQHILYQAITVLYVNVTAHTTLSSVNVRPNDGPCTAYGSPPVFRGIIYAVQRAECTR